MKKIISFTLIIICMIIISACNKPSVNYETSEDTTSNTNDSEILTVYFSCTQNTKKIADHIIELTNSEVFRIIPTVAYTSSDLNYNDSTSRSSKENSDPTSRPQIANSIENISKYKVIFLGYPIWWGKAPKIIYTFLESYTFEDTIIIPFATSSSSQLGSSATNLHSLASNAEWKEGRRFSSSSTKDQVKTWIDGLNIDEYINKTEELKMNISVNGHNLTATLVDNSSTRALLDLLKQGSITVNATDYGNFEKVGTLPTSLPSNNEQITTQAGDIILYLGNSICFYYATNSYNFTRLGKIDNVNASELREIYGSGSATFILSLS